MRWSVSRTTCAPASSAPTPRQPTPPQRCSSATAARSGRWRSTSAMPRRSTRVFAERARRDRAGDPRRRPALPRLGGLRPPDRLRGERQRHAQPARGHAPARARRDVRVLLDEQGLRRPAQLRCPCWSWRSGWSCPRTTATTGASTRPCRSTASTHSLFGVSKAAADLLVQEYGRYFDMPTVCFRGGCLTGPNHAGTQLHGFLSYLMRCTMTGEPYTVFGYGGKQVRDNIHSADLVGGFDAFHRAPRAGAVYNIGGGRAEQLLDARGDRALPGDRRTRARLGAWARRTGSAIIAGGSATWRPSSTIIPTGAHPRHPRHPARDPRRATPSDG